nr:MAG TPA: Putative tail protein [Caudoviricetes sp.]
MSWTIYDKTGQIAKCEIHQLEYNGEFMGECSVVCTIKSESPIELAIGDYLIYRGERFEINYDPTILKKASKNSTGDAFTYDNVKFNSLSDELTRCDFLDYVPRDNNIHFTSLPKFSFFASSISNLAERIQVNLDRIYTGDKKWTVTVHPEYVNKKNINISVDTINVWDALALTNSEFEANFIIRGREITIGTAGIAVDNIFKYGKGKGLYEIERNAEADQKIVTRLRAYGSTRNMPDRYYNKLSGSSVGNYLPNNMAVDNLMLPGFPETTLDPYIDSDNIEELGIREGTIFFDGSQEGLEEIFPSIEGMTAQQLEDAGITVSIDPGDNGNLDEVYSAEQLTDDGQADNKGEIEKGSFTVTLKDIGFDINNYLLGETATLSMKDGMCGGRDFEITKCEKHGNKYILTCTRVYDDGIKLFFPYKNYNIKSGDKFVLLDISMPDVYIKAHSQRLLSSAKKWLAKNDYIRYSYIPKVDNIYMARQHDDAVANNQTSIHDTIKEGDLMLFEDDDLGISGSIIIDSLSIKEGDDMIPKYEISLKEEKIVGTLEKIQNQIDSIVNGGQGNGGYNSEQIKSLIKAFGSNFFLRKDKDDRTPHKLSSDKAFEIGKFVSGSTGGIIMVDKETGQTYAEVDKLKVRMKAYFESLEIQNVNSVGGKIVLTPGGAVTLIDVWTKGTIEQTPILSMADGNPILLADGSELQLMDKETVDNGVPEGVYRCFFLAEQDGVEVENRFRAGFQIQSKNFNIQKPGEYQQVANHYYWRLCVGASKEPINVGIYKLHYIDLSMADCDTGSDIPAKGDTVAHLGARIKWKGIDNKDVTDESNIDAQNAIVFSSTDVFSPSVTLYHGIDSYSYLNKEYVEYGVDKTNNKAFFHVYGDAYIGDRDGNSFVKFTQGEGVELKGKLSVGTTIGNGDTIEDALKKASEKYIEDLDPLKEYIKQEIDNIQNQVDGAIETWFYDPVPTLENLPASDWDTDEKKNNHLGDLYYSKEGKAYRFQYEQEKGWYWNAITDTDIVKALENAQKAQDTADGKRRIFVRQPQNSDAYDIGDMWVNATYGTTYKDDMLRANTSKKAGEAFSISHWELASKYTDDTVAKEAQKIAEETKKAAEKLDSTVSSMKDFTDEAFNDGIVDRGEAAAIQKYLNTIATTQKDVTESYSKIIENELLDEGVVKTELKTAYRLFNNSAQELINTINGVIQDGKTTATEVAMVDGKYSAFNLKYGDFIAHINAANNYIQEKLNASIKEISKNIGDISYLTKALKEYTNIEGGLIQSSLLALGYTSESGFKIMSGTNGVYQSDKRGGGIASWWGGSMLDKFDYPESSVPENVAKGLVRFDGTGYFANGALWWEEDGTLHADPLSFFVGEETVGVLLSAFKFLRSAEFKYILEPQYPFTHIKAINSVQIGNALLKYDATNNAVYVEKDDGSMVNFYATGDLAAFGSTTGGGSGATSLGMLDDVDLTVPLSDGMVLTYDSIKNKWTNKKGGGGLDIDAMWDELAKSDTSKRIHFSHIPDLGSVYAKQVKLGTTPYNVSNGVISLPAYPTKLSQLEDDIVTGKYLPKAGGTITGNLAINGTTTTNNIVLNKAGNFGNKINFGDGDYVYLKEASDDSLTIYGSKKISLNGSGFGYSFGSDGLIPTSGSKSLGGGWNSNMWSTVWANKVGCTIIGSEPDNAHDGGSPWNGLSFAGNDNFVHMSGYYGIAFYTSAGRVAQFQSDGIVNITNLYCYNNIQCRASFASTMTDRWQLQWPIYFNPDNAVFRANQLSLMMHNSCRPIISWKDTLDGVGWQTRYTIGTYRPDYDTWGTMLIAVSNDDGGNSPGIRLELEASNNRAVVQGSFLASGEITAYSDARLKSCIKPLRNRGVITPVSYIKDGKESIGFIAQDMIELYPELVSKGSSKEHYLSVNYAQYTAVLQAQIIELHKEIDDLKRKFIN